jgi:hypothetical protein
MPGGGQCHGYSLQGGNLCYFHNRQRLAAQKTASPMDSIEIPLLEDRCAIQVTITGILRAIVNKTIDRPRASLLLYGLQLSLQSVDRSSWAIPIGTVKALSKTSDGDELAANPDDEDPDDEGGDDRVIMEGLVDGDNREIMEGLVADLEYLDSVRRQAGLDPDPSPLLPALRAHLSARSSAPPVPPSLSADPNPSNPSPAQSSLAPP